MNIFKLDESPKLAAEMHCDKHCVKQILESLQILSCAVIRHGATPDQMPLTAKGTPYRGGYPHHPSSRWGGDSRSNFLWLCDLAENLCKEYTFRYGKIHSCEAKLEILKDLSYLIPNGPETPFAVAISQDSICRQKITNFENLSVVSKYREYYNYDKSRFAKWTKREAPNWYKVK